MNEAASLPTSTPGADQPSSESAVIAEEISAWVADQRADMMQRLCRQSLGLSTLHVLAMLDVVGPLTMSRLAELRGVSLPDATGIVSRMEERALVERAHDAHDRRLVLVALSELGRKTAAELEFVPRVHLVRILEEMPPAEREHLARGFRAFAEASRRVGRPEDACPAGLLRRAETDNSGVRRGSLAGTERAIEGAGVTR